MCRKYQAPQWHQVKDVFLTTLALWLNCINDLFALHLFSWKNMPCSFMFRSKPFRCWPTGIRKWMCSAKAERRGAAQPEDGSGQGGHEVRGIGTTTLVGFAKRFLILYCFLGVSMGRGGGVGVPQLRANPTDLGGGARRLGIGTKSPCRDVENSTQATEALDATTKEVPTYPTLSRWS